MAKVYYESDADIGVLRDRKVAIIGYGNQGRAQALNLRDSGVTPLIGVRQDETQARAEEDGFATAGVADAAAQCDVLMILIPDEVMPQVFDESIRPHLNEGDAISFATGYNVAFGLLTPPANVDVVMIAPRMIGQGVRDTYVEGSGFPSFVGVHQDATGNALAVCLAIAQGIGTTRSGALELTFAQEAELDLFTEQGFGPAFGQVLMGSLQTLIDAGYPEEAALIEILLSGEFAYSMEKIREIGFFKQMELHSTTSQYGSMTRGMRFIIPELHDKLAEVLKEIKSGDFAREWTAEQAAGHPMLAQLREMRTMHPIAEWERKTREAFRMDKPED